MELTGLAGPDFLQQTRLGQQLLLNKNIYLFGKIGITYQPKEKGHGRKPYQCKEVDEKLKNHQNHYCGDPGKKRAAPGLP